MFLYVLVSSKNSGHFFYPGVHVSIWGCDDVKPQFPFAHSNYLLAATPLHLVACPLKFITFWFLNNTSGGVPERSSIKGKVFFFFK